MSTPIPFQTHFDGLFGQVDHLYGRMGQKREWLPLGGYVRAIRRTQPSLGIPSNHPLRGEDRGVLRLVRDVCAESTNDCVKSLGQEADRLLEQIKLFECLRKSDFFRERLFVSKQHREAFEASTEIMILEALEELKNIKE